MKLIKLTLLALLMTLATAVDAKQVKAPHVYMFGFSGSFTDSLIYLTDIQDVQQVWVDTKTKFLLGRDNYSYQLKNYLSENLQQPNRVCVVFFAKSKKKAEKMYVKLRKKYLNNPKASYDIRYISEQEFKFEPIDISEE
jgi:hypothetical protein